GQDLSGELGELAAHLAHHHVPHGEADLRVRAVDSPGTSHIAGDRCPRQGLRHVSLRCLLLLAASAVAHSMIEQSTSNTWRCDLSNVQLPQYSGSVNTTTRWLTADEQRTWRLFMTACQSLFSSIDAQLLRDSGLPLGYYEILVHLSESPGRAL